MMSKTIQCEDSIDAIYDYFCDTGRTDGLPIIPPTRERVAAMTAAVDRSPSECVARLLPRAGEATIEKLAINAVMAGCLPSYFPVVVAAVEAMAEPQFKLGLLNTTTNPVTPMLVVNGPVRQKIGLNCGWGVLGPGWRANATIGRAITLILLNIAGRIPGEGSKAVLGQPARYGLCIGEREEASPWEPLHVERGFKPEESVVTVTNVCGVHSLEDWLSTAADGMLTTLAGGMHIGTTLNAMPAWGVSQMPLVLCPGNAHVLARDGLSKYDVKKELHERTKDIPLSYFAQHHLDEIMLEDRLESVRYTDRRAAIEAGWVKPGQTQLTNKGVALTSKPEQFIIVVAGGDAGYHSAFCPSFTGSFAVSKLIRSRD